MSETFLEFDPPRPRELRRLREHVWKHLKRAGLGHLGHLGHLGRRDSLVGTGGTLRNLAKIDRGRLRYPISQLHGYVLSLENLHGVVSHLAATREKRREETRRDRGIERGARRLDRGWCCRDRDVHGVRSGPTDSRLRSGRARGHCAELNGFTHEEIALVSGLVRLAGNRHADPRRLRPLIASADGARLDRGAVVLALADEIERRCPRGRTIAVSCEVGRDVKVSVPLLPMWRTRDLGQRFERAFRKPLVVRPG